MGVASGLIDLFLCGQDHRELVLAGPVSTAVVGLEGRAPTGGVLTRQATVTAAGDPRTQAIDGALLLMGRPEPGRVPELVGDGEGRTPDLAESGIPVGLRGHTGTLVAGEHRQAAIGFVQAKGIDELLSDSGPGAVWDALDAIVSAAQRAAAAHGVTFLYTDVDAGAAKLLLLAGAPVAHGDDGDRLLLALRDIVATQSPLLLRAGADQGPAFVVDIGTAFRRHFTVMGDPVNLAARLMGKSGRGEVLASLAIVEHTRLPFDLRPVAPLTLKGKAAPVDAVVVGEVAEEPDGGESRAAAVTLVGRSAESGVLAKLLADATKGLGGAVELVGEPGIGKSTLLRDALDGVPAGALVLHIAGRSYGAGTPYRALRGPLRWLLGVARRDDRATETVLRVHVATRLPELAELLPLLAIPFGLELEPTETTRRLAPEFARRELERGMLALLEQSLPANDAVVVIEDAHWLDEASSALLAGIVARARDHGWAAISTRRDVEGGLVLASTDSAAVVHRIALEPLGDEAARALVEAGGTEGLAPQDVERLVERSHGNPLFLRELVAAARRDGVGSLPESLETLLAARIDTLDPAARDALRTAAVVGSRIEPELLDDLLEDASARTALAGLIDGEDFLYAERDGRLSFRHALIRDAAYAALPHRRRRELHGRTGDAMLRAAGARAGDLAGELSLHFHEARRWDASWMWSGLAGDQAMKAAAPIEAVEAFGRALEAADHAGGVLRVEDVLDIAQRTADAGDLAGRYEEARRALVHGRRVAAGHPVLAARLWWRDGWLVRPHGRVRGRAGHVRRGTRPPGPKRRARGAAAHHAGDACARRIAGALSAGFTRPSRRCSPRSSAPGRRATTRVWPARPRCWTGCSPTWDARSPGTDSPRSGAVSGAGGRRWPRERPQQPRHQRLLRRATGPRRWTSTGRRPRRVPVSATSSGSPSLRTTAARCSRTRANWRRRRPHSAWPGACGPPGRSRQGWRSCAATSDASPRGAAGSTRPRRCTPRRRRASSASGPRPSSSRSDAGSRSSACSVETRRRQRGCWPICDPTWPGRRGSRTSSPWSTG